MPSLWVLVILKACHITSLVRWNPVLLESILRGQNLEQYLLVEVLSTWWMNEWIPLKPNEMSCENLHAHWVLFNLFIYLLIYLRIFLKAYSTWYFQAVFHLHTNQTWSCLPSKIRWDLTHSGWCSHRHAHWFKLHRLYILWNKLQMKCLSKYKRD